MNLGQSFGLGAYESSVFPNAIKTSLSPPLSAQLDGWGEDGSKDVLDGSLCKFPRQSSWLIQHFWCPTQELKAACQPKYLRMAKRICPIRASTKSEGIPTLIK